MAEKPEKNNLTQLFPVLTESEKKDIRLYLSSIEADSDQSTRAAIVLIRSQARFTNLLQNLTDQAALAQNRKRLNLLKEAVLNEHIMPYINLLLELGYQFAELGFDLEVCYELMTLYKLCTQEALVKSLAADTSLLSALRGLERIDQADRLIITQAYLEAKKEIANADGIRLKPLLSEISAYKYALDESAIIALTDQKGIITHVNDNFCKISKYSREELIGKDHRIINSGYHPKAFIKALWTTIANGKVWKGELKNKAKDGTIYWVDTTIVPFLNEAGKPYQYLAIRSDITERKTSEEHLQQTLHQIAAYKYALDESAIVALTDQKGIITHVNDNFCKISKYSREELIGKDHRIINSGYHPKTFIKALWTTIANGKVWKGELKNKAKDGTIYWVDTTIVPFLNEAGKPYQYLAIRSDITERKAAETHVLELNESLERKVNERTQALRTSFNEISNFKQLFETIPGLYLVLLPDLTISAVTNEYLAATMLTREQILGRHLFDVFPDNPDDATADGVNNLRKSLNIVLSTKQSHTMPIQKYDIRRPDGTFEERYWSPINKAVLNAEKEVVYLTHSVVDVTTQLQHEQELIRVTEEKRDLYDNAPCGYLSVDASIFISNINETLLSWLGYSAEEVIGKMKFEDLLSEQSRKVHLSTFDEVFAKYIKDGSVSDLEFDFARKDHTTFPALVNSMAVFDENGAFVRSRTVVLDNTFRKKSEHRLREANSELEAQAQKLQASEEELRAQQEELMQANAELEEKSLLLEEKNQIVLEKNEELTAASAELHQKAEELALSNKYKSEFLANMSHELRTPLNSILLLSKLLADNAEKNLTNDQVEFANIINNSGKGLLELINEILDLSKIEAGKMTLDIESLRILNLCKVATDLFIPLAKEKGITFGMTIQENVPASIVSDRIRIDQVLKNFLSNALKFTEAGSVQLIVRRPNDNEAKSLSIYADHLIAFEVSDTGIGIPLDKQGIIFEAFKQADGSTRRKYGGTGLGLSISRKIALMLGGDVFVQSEPDRGSSFTLVIPVDGSTVENSNNAADLVSNRTIQQSTLSDSVQRDTNITENAPQEIADDRSNLSPGDKMILLIEDDTSFAQSLVGLIHRRGYKVVVTVSGASALDFAKKYKPVGILLDVKLPVKSGWTVLKELKQDATTRHIPIHLMSSGEITAKEFLNLGALDFVQKPITADTLTKILDRLEDILGHFPKTVMIVDPNESHVRALQDFITSAWVECIAAHTPSEAIKILQNKRIDSVVLDPGLPEESCFKLMEYLKVNPKLESIPVILYTGKPISSVEEKKISARAGELAIRTAATFKNLADEIAFFLHLTEHDENETKNTKPYIRENALAGKHILIADDDVRNIFSLTKLLETKKMIVSSAIDGNEAITILEKDPTIDLVLMDMMMPEKDGYETISFIRSNPKLAAKKIIALTAKAMASDREKCLSAGANDYITKPVDTDQLISLLNVWLYT